MINTDTERLRSFAAGRPPTPCAVFDLNAAVMAFDWFANTLGDAGHVQFAVKARPDPQLLAALARRGSAMDVSSPAEVDAAIAAGCPPERLSYSNVFADTNEIAHAHDQGVRIFCADTAHSIDQISRVSPGATVLVRIAHSGTGSAITLSGRFGCPPDQAAELALHAADRGLDVAGLAWHLGCQQRDHAQWHTATATAAHIWARAVQGGLRSLRMLNTGGGLPGSYRTPAPSPAEHIHEIRTAVAHHFGTHPPTIILEPGRGLVADAGATLATVKAVVRRADCTYVVLDAGIWNAGFIEVLAGIDYRISALDHPEGAPDEPVEICGPTCDSLDTLSSVRDPYRLPSALAPGDRIAIWSTGAYCSTNASVGFNGYPPINQHLLPLVSDEFGALFDTTAQPVNGPVQFT